MVKKGQKYSSYLIVDEHGIETEKLKRFAEDIGMKYVTLRARLDLSLDKQTIRLQAKDYIVIKVKKGNKI